MMKILVSALSAMCVLSLSNAAYAACGDFDLEPLLEECDDGNLADGDGCSSLCTVEEAFVCEDVTFTVQNNDTLDGGVAPNWVVDPDGRGISQTTNSVATVYSTNMGAQITEIIFDMRVATTGDDDFLGWTIGYDEDEMRNTGAEPVNTDFLYFSWKQSEQSISGQNREAGMILSRVTGPADDATYWGGRNGNIAQVAEATVHGLGDGNGWDDNRWYRVNMVVTPGRVRVWLREGNTDGSGNPSARAFPPLDRTTHLEFDERIDIPAGTFGFYAQSQDALRYELISPVSDSVCSPDQDEDGVKDLSDLDSDRDGVLDLDEMPGFLDDPDADEDLDGIPDWNDPDHIPGGCAAAGNVCATLPVEMDIDGDGIPNHLDKDSDGDGITDVREAGLIDDDGDGTPDACTSVTDRGVCVAGGLAEPPTNTDGDSGPIVPDYLDSDSDDDGISDANEAHDLTGNAMADVTPSGSDTDGDGIDDAFDPDCVALLCGGVIGAPILGVLTPAQDSDLDGVPDWQTTCGDAYVRGSEACDDGNNVNADTCTNACLRTNTQMCSDDGQCASDACDPTLMTCQVCEDDSAAGTDNGCSGATPSCLTGAVNTCVECTLDTHCGSSEVCVGNQCITCSDDVAGNGQDTGCRADAPICDTSGAIPVCVVCTDDIAGGTDTGCAAGAPVCDTTLPGGTCIACEDNAGGTSTDFGCAMATPVCTDPIGIEAPLCVECVIDDHCPAMGEVCGADNTCVMGCNELSDCEGTAAPICDLGDRTCVECLLDTDCSGDEVCGLGVCALPDSDLDGIADGDDLDDDNDGILDTDEGNGTDFSVDSDGDGWPDYKDPDSVTCEDANTDGACDTLPMSVDFDADGIPNHLDLDADGDGIADIIEGGGEDTTGNGRVDVFVDGNRNGVADVIDATPLPLPNTDMSAGPDFLDLDSDGDGMTDTFEAGGTDDDGDGHPDVATDDNFDGWADELDGGDALSLPDFDGDDTPDYQDVDSDGDGITDGVEGHMGTAPSGDDTDLDGIDDAFDPDCIDAVCGGLIGMIATMPNTDESGRPDYLDLDSDGDGITDDVECPMDPTCSDVDMDGIPDFRSLDADGDGLLDATEGHDVDHDGVADVEAVGVDSDGDGIDDAFDANCTEAEPCGAVVGAPAPTPDLDLDDAPDFQDPDDDGDGKPTAEEIQDAMDYEGPAADSTNIDGDAVVNWFDEDSDGDGASDMTENGGDGDANDDGLLDYLDPGFAPVDSDGDGIIDVVECGGIPDDGCVDSDMDGLPDHLDSDDDNDGILTADEYSAEDFVDGDPANDHDADDDGVLNHLDLDSDNDGIPDLWENGGRALDANSDGRVDDTTDADMDGIASAFDTDDADADVRATAAPVNTDGAGQADYLDLDADGDGMTDIFEADGTDADGDGMVDGATDDDGDGWADSVAATPWPLPDTDLDGDLDFQDVDSDGDGKSDALEATDEGADGVADVMPAGVDANGNGIDDVFDGSTDGTAPTTPDRDGDGVDDWRDPDDDGDGVPTTFEEDGDTDMDGTPDYLDNDDDGDGILTQFESPDPNGDMNPEDAQDTDGDGIPDYLDPDDDGDGIPTADEMPDPNGDGDPADAVDSDGDGTPDYLSGQVTVSGGLAGGAFCSASPGSEGAPAAWLLLGLGLVGYRRRRR